MRNDGGWNSMRNSRCLAIGELVGEGGLGALSHNLKAARKGIGLGQDLGRKRIVLVVFKVTSKMDTERAGFPDCLAGHRQLALKMVGTR
jgi:hypothetical protein